MISKTKGGLFVDDRGYIKFVNNFDFSEVKRFYQVENHKKGFVRAWHGHKKEGKYVYVAKGSILLGVVPLGDTSDDPQKMTLSSQDPTVVYVPPGHYNGFKTLEEDTIVIFFSTSTLEESRDDDIRMEWDSLPNLDIWGDNWR